MRQLRVIGTGQPENIFGSFFLDHVKDSVGRGHRQRVARIGAADAAHRGSIDDFGPAGHG